MLDCLTEQWSHLVTGEPLIHSTEGAVNVVLWHSHESNYKVSAQTTILYNEFEKYAYKITTTSARGQWVQAKLLYTNHSSISSQTLKMISFGIIH